MPLWMEFKYGASDVDIPRQRAIPADTKENGWISHSMVPQANRHQGPGITPLLVAVRKYGTAFDLYNALQYYEAFVCPLSSTKMSCSVNNLLELCCTNSSK